MQRDQEHRQSSQDVAVGTSELVQEQVRDSARPVHASQPAEIYTGIAVVVAGSAAEIEALRPVWQQMQDREPFPKPNADIDRYMSVVEASKGEVKPYVILFKQGDQPLAMVVARSQERQVDLKLAHKTLFRPTLKCLNIVYGGILGRPNGELCHIVVSELTKKLKSREFDLVRFNYMNAGTAVCDAVRKTPGFFTRGHFPTATEHWRMSVPEKMDDFYRACSRRHRGSLRRIVRKFEQEYQDRGAFVKYTKEGEVDDFVRIAAEVSSKTYQHVLGVGLVNDEQTRCQIRSAAKHGWFHGCILFAGDEPCAFQIGLCYRQVYYLVNLGYDPTLGSYGVGTNLFLRVLESLCDDRSIESFDFYFGDAEYKKRYGTEHWSEVSAYIFAPRIYPLFVNLARCGLAAMNATMVYVAGKTGWKDWIKRRWRNELRATSSRVRTDDR